LPPTVLASTTEIIIGTSAIATTTTPGNSTDMTTEKLIRAMEELKLQVSELK